MSERGPRVYFDSDDVFCANPACLLHVRRGDTRVDGWGQWATVDGITYDRHALEAGGPCYCNACRRRMRAKPAGTGVG
jgi:hypothetical protein